MMRRAGRIVNEMEFRMLRAAQSFSPPVRASTKKGFFAFAAIADDRRASVVRTMSAPDQTSHTSRSGRTSFRETSFWQVHAIRSTVSLTACRAFIDLIVSLHRSLTRREQGQ
jgi:hypothetical protein